jgi:hypothetical protein
MINKNKFKNLNYNIQFKKLLNVILEAVKVIFTNYNEKITTLQSENDGFKKKIDTLIKKAYAKLNDIMNNRLNESDAHNAYKNILAFDKILQRTEFNTFALSELLNKVNTKISNEGGKISAPATIFAFAHDFATTHASRPVSRPEAERAKSVVAGAGRKAGAGAGAEAEAEAEAGRAKSVVAGAVAKSVVAGVVEGAVAKLGAVAGPGPAGRAGAVAGPGPEAGPEAERAKSVVAGAGRKAGAGAGAGAEAEAEAGRDEANALSKLFKNDNTNISSKEDKGNQPSQLSQPSQRRSPFFTIDEDKEYSDNEEVKGGVSGQRYANPIEEYNGANSDDDEVIRGVSGRRYADQTVASNARYAETKKINKQREQTRLTNSKDDTKA